MRDMEKQSDVDANSTQLKQREKTNKKQARKMLSKKKENN